MKDGNIMIYLAINKFDKNIIFNYLLIYTPLRLIFLLL